jgi:hypothetical protein
MSRWISWVRPPSLPLTLSRWLRSEVAPGSIEYSAVTQPVPLPRRWGGMRSSMVAAHSTWVSPSRMTTDAAAHFWTSSSTETGRSWVGSRPSCRVLGPFPMLMIHSLHARPAPRERPPPRA